MMPPLVLAAHGTRDPAGVAELEALAGAVRARLAPTPVLMGYVDVIGPKLSEVIPDRAVVVPAFLTTGYHVRVDVPAQVRQSGRREVLVTPPLGPDPLLLDAAVSRLVAAGMEPGDAVVLTAAGSAEPRAHADLAAAVQGLATRLGSAVHLGYVSTGQPSVRETVAVVRGRGASRVSVATWLLAPGLFQRRLSRCGADVIASPLGAHPLVVEAVLRRYRAALAAHAA